MKSNRFVMVDLIALICELIDVLRDCGQDVSEYENRLKLIEKKEKRRK